MSIKNSSRRIKAYVNIAFAFALELVNVLAGFIVPRLVIRTFGSDANGLVSSISNFLGYVTLLQSGAGSVIRVALYKPLAQKNHEELCTVVRTAESFFRKIAYITIGYIAILAVAFPTIITPEYEFWYTFSLVVVVGISTVARYFFGLSYQMLVEADQRSYIFSAIQIVTVILNAVSTVVLTNLGCSIQVVKAVSAIFFVLRPLSINLYAKRYYKIDRSVKCNNALISQRWDGLAQAVAYFVHTKAPVFALTVFSTLKNVSVFSIYALITAGLTSFVNCINKGMRALIGNIVAKGEKEKLQQVFSSYQTLLHILATACFATACITAHSFLDVYLKDVHDAEYIQPVFAILLFTAEFLYCLRLPYSVVMMAAGKFREMKKPAYIEAGINFTLSCVLVHFLGLVGVAIGTLVAMTYRTVSFINFLRKDILHISRGKQIAKYAVTFAVYALCICLFGMISVKNTGYLSWAIYAASVFVGCGVIILAVNFLFWKEDTKTALRYVMRRKTKR